MRACETKTGTAAVEVGAFCQCPQSGRFMEAARLLLHVCRANASCAYGALHFFGLHHPGEDGTKMGSIFSYHVLRCASFPSLPPVKTGQKWDPFLSLTSTRQWSGWKCCSCFIASKGAYDILRTVAMADERSPRNPRDTSCGSQRQFAYYMRRKPPGQTQDCPLI